MRDCRPRVQAIQFVCFACRRNLTNIIFVPEVNLTVEGQMVAGTNATPRPHSGKTRRVWQIADEITNEKGRRAKRSEVKERVLAEGGNENTANTQYQAWKTDRDKRQPTATPASVPCDIEPRSLQVNADGRLLIPHEMRAAMQLGPAGRVIASVEAGELRLVSQELSIRRAQAHLRRYRETGESVGGSVSRRAARAVGGSVSVVFDSSALLTIAFQEDGADVAAGYVHDGIMSAVNASEVVGKFVDLGFADAEARRALLAFGLIIRPFDENGAICCCRPPAFCDTEARSAPWRPCVPGAGDP